MVNDEPASRPSVETFVNWAADSAKVSGYRLAENFRGFVLTDFRCLSSEDLPEGWEVMSMNEDMTVYVRPED